MKDYKRYKISSIIAHIYIKIKVKTLDTSANACFPI